LDADGLKDVAEWLENYREFWEASFDRLDDYLRELQKEQKKTQVKEKKNVRKRK
jgi:hypothetical protein